MCKVRRMDSN